MYIFLEIAEFELLKLFISGSHKVNINNWYTNSRFEFQSWMGIWGFYASQHFSKIISKIKLWFGMSSNKKLKQQQFCWETKLCLFWPVQNGPFKLNFANSRYSLNYFFLSLCKLTCGEPRANMKGHKACNKNNCPFKAEDKDCPYSAPEKK